MKNIYQLVLLLFLIPHSSFAAIDLELTLTANKTEYSIYQQITYTLIIDNNGNETATGIKVKVPIAPGVAFSGSSTSNGSYNLFFQEWTLSTLEVNQSENMTLTIFTLNEDAPLPAFAQVITADQNDSDSTPNNGTCCEANEDDEAALIINPEGFVQQEADLSLNIGGNSAGGIEGDEFNLEVRMTNLGLAIATNIQIKLELSEGLDFASNPPSNFDANTGILSVSSIPSNAFEVIDIPVIIGNQSGGISYFGQIWSVDQNDPDSTPGNNTTQIRNEDDESGGIIQTNITDVNLEMEIDKNVVAADDLVVFTLDARKSSPVITTDIVINLGLPNNLEYVSHEFSDDFGIEVTQTYIPDQGIWTIETMEFSAPHEVNLYQLKVTAKVLSMTEPTIIGAEFLAHFPITDFDSNPNSFPNLFFDPDDFLHDEEDDEAIVTLFPTGSQPATIFGVTFRDGFRQGIDYLTVSKNQGINGMTIYLYEATDLSQPIQTLETFSNDIQRRGRYHFNHLDPSKNYIIQYTNQGGNIFNSFGNLLLGPVQQSPFLEPSNEFSQTIPVTPDEEVEIDFAWVDGEDCTLDSADADAICNDNNTTNPNDDTYNIRYSAAGKGAFSISGDLTVNNQEYPNNRLTPAETSYYLYPSFDTYEKWFEAELNLPVNGASSKTLTFTNDATLSDIPCEETIAVPAPSTCSQAIDIELNFEIDNIAPEPFQDVTITLNVTNAGSATAEDVEVELYLPDGGFPGDKFDNQIATSSQGSYEAAVQIWSIGDIGAGQMATLELQTNTPQLIEGETIPMFTQVTRAHGYDPDSDVNNDTDQIADEDDEGFILFGDNRKVDFELVEFYPVQATYNETDLVEFYMEVRNSNDAEIEMDGATIQIDLPSNFEFDSFEFADCQGNCFYSVFAEGNNGLTFFNLMPGESASTVVRYSVTGFTGTTDVFAQVASQIQGDIDSAPNNGICCTVQEDDEAVAQVEIGGGTNPTEGVDLELEYTTDSPTFNRWTTVNYTLTASNAGTEAASNIVIDVPIPNGLAFTSQTTSNGNFNLFSQTWTIPNLAAGDSETLNLTLFTLVNDPVTNFAQVKSMDQDDVDSTPNNNAGIIPQEDDEAAVTISPAGSAGGKNALEGVIDQSTTLKLYELFPVPALDNLQVVFGTAGNQVSVVLYDIHGKLLKRTSHRVLKGENALQLEVSDLAAGFYTISLETPEGFVRGKFLKQ